MDSVDKLLSKRLKFNVSPSPCTLTSGMAEKE